MVEKEYWTRSAASNEDTGIGFSSVWMGGGKKRLLVFVFPTPLSWPREMWGKKAMVKKRWISAGRMDHIV